MQVTHIFHSGFLVELSHTLLLFDYWQGILPQLAPDKPLFVFVSHRHHDHYSREIWRLAEHHPKVWYVVDSGVPLPPSCPQNLLVVQPRQQYNWQGIQIETIRSTDEGCAFLVQAEDRAVYHAGDLNWWHWEGEPEADDAWHDQAFHEELDRIRGRRFDLAFLPLDPRQEANAWWGVVDFLQACPCDHVFPMHYAADRDAMLAYLRLPELAPWLPRIHTEDCWTDEKTSAPILKGENDG